MSIRISVQICSYNRKHLLERSLRALMAQDLPKDQYEIVFVDDGSTDGSADMARALAAEGGCRIKVFSKANDGLARARNLGVMVGCMVGSSLAMAPAAPIPLARAAVG